jgi:hypothetical protein
MLRETIYIFRYYKAKRAYKHGSHFKYVKHVNRVKHLGFKPMESIFIFRYMSIDSIHEILERE